MKNVVVSLLMLTCLSAQGAISDLMELDGVERIEPINVTRTADIFYGEPDRVLSSHTYSDRRVSTALVKFWKKVNTTGNHIIYKNVYYQFNTRFGRDHFQVIWKIDGQTVRAEVLDGHKKVGENVWSFDQEGRLLR